MLDVLELSALVIKKTQSTILRPIVYLQQLHLTGAIFNLPTPILNSYSHHLPVSVVTAVNGATLLMLNGYSFTNPAPMTGGERWYCSGRIRWNCNVCLCVNDDYELVCVSNEHTHKPPVYEKTPDGLYKETIPWVTVLRFKFGWQFLLYLRLSF